MGHIVVVLALAINEAAEIPVGEALTAVGRLGAVVARLAERVGQTGLVDGLDQLLHLLDRHTRRDRRVDVFAVLERLDSLRSMGPSLREDRHAIDIGLLEHFVVVGVCLRYLMLLRLLIEYVLAQFTQHHLVAEGMHLEQFHERLSESTKSQYADLDSHAVVLSLLTLPALFVHRQRNQDVRRLDVSNAVHPACNARLIAALHTCRTGPAAAMRRRIFLARVPGALEHRCSTSSLQSPAGYIILLNQ